MATFDEFGTPIDTTITAPEEFGNYDQAVFQQAGYPQDDVSGVDAAVFANTGYAQDDVTGVDQAVFVQSGYAQDDVAGVDAAVAAQAGLQTGVDLNGGNSIDLGSISDKVAGAFNSALSDMKSVRLGAAGLLSGGLGKLFGKSTARGLKGPVSWKENGVAVNHDADDWRVKLSVPTGSNLLYTNDYSCNSSVLYPLKQTEGVIFPYTPQIQVTQTAGYATQKLTHSNYSAFFYEGSEVSQINLTADFTVQNEEEGRYLMACIYFFRSATKMFFGKDKPGDGNPAVGTPPPMVFLSGYGTHYFPKVPCIITSFTHTMPQDVDYLETPVEGGITRLPTKSTIQLNLQPMYSRKRVREFNHRDFSDGKLLDKGFI